MGGVGVQIIQITDGMDQTRLGEQEVGVGGWGGGRMKGDEGC